MYLVVGLGNPGEKYTFTRHNTGFLAIDYIAQKQSINVKKIKHKAIIGEGSILNQKVVLVKPQTFMNLSGESIQQLVSWYKVELNKLIVIYDDVSMPVGSLRIREKGSAGGHNGIKSIILNLNTDEFTRIKIGVDAKPDGYDLADYVLGKFSDNQQKIMFETFEKVNLAIEELIRSGTKSAMNKYNFIRS
ncbi:MAG: aminoacyl-tRNA hydrolase [Clostridia bacterium]|nr:aminoacyl-tRNA hydrolase [Clostridia bacterium]